MTTQAEKGRRFAELHAREEPFLLPNPWDVGSARLMQGLGFEALATTSGGFAYTLGKLDGTPTLEEKLAHCTALAAATDIPLSADFEDGFARPPEDVARNVEALVGTGVAGCSIEDWDRDAGALFDLELAVDRVAAAAEAAHGLDFPFVLTARAEQLLRAGRDLDEVIRRLQAFEAAGADALYAPFISSLDDLRTIAAEVNAPLNVLGGVIQGASFADLTAAGAQRVSIGGLLTNVAARPILEFGEAMLRDGSFEWASEAAPYARMMELMGRGG